MPVRDGDLHYPMASTLQVSIILSCARLAVSAHERHQPFFNWRSGHAIDSTLLKATLASKYRT